MTRRAMTKFEPMPPAYIKAISESHVTLIAAALRLRDWLRKQQ